MKLKLGELNAVALCQYTSFAAVVDAALGGGDGGGKDPDRVDLAAGAPSMEAAIANINAALNFG